MPYTSTNIVEDLVVGPGQTLTFSPSSIGDTTAFWLVAAPYDAWVTSPGGPNVLIPDDPTLINYGNLIATDVAQESWGVNVLFIDGRSYWSGVTVENHGLMSAFSQHSEAFAFRASSWAPSILNTGRMIAEAPEHYAVAISSYGQNMPTPFSWTWSIRNAPSGELIAIGDIANTVRTPFATFFNEGLVRAEGGQQAVGVWANGGHIENSGEIIAEADADGQEVGIGLGLIDAFNSARDTTIINSGLIRAETAITENYSGGVVTTIVNSGAIEGAIVLLDGDDVLRNSGSIIGDVELGAGADLYDGRGGVLQGVLNAGANDDTLLLDLDGGTFDGGAGVDFAAIDLSGASGAVTYAHSDAQASLAVGGAVILTLIGVERLDITCGAGADQITGGALDDVIRLGLGGGVADGGGGNDFVSLDFSDRTGSVVYTHSNTEAQALVGGVAAAIVRNAEAVEIIGGSGTDQLTGGAGDDILSGGGGADVLNGGGGRDTASYAHSSSGVAITLAGSASGGEAAGDTLSGIESLIGSAFADTLTGDSGANTLDGGAGADILNGGGGDDVYVVDHINDAISEGASQGRDLVRSAVSFALGANVEDLVLTGAAAASAIGNALDNVIVGNDGDNLLIGGAGADDMDGGGGVDTASYALSGSPVNVSLATGFGSGGDAEGDFLINFEGLIGSAFGDTLVGNFRNNVIVGGAGADQIDGADGLDIADYSGSAAAVSVNLLTGAGAGGDAQGDVLVHIEGVRGSDFDDVLVGSNSGVNRLYGGAGDDFLVGGFVPGVLDGGDGFDTVSYAFFTMALTVDLTKSKAYEFPNFFDTLISIEKVIGSDFNDRFIGDTRDNWFDGSLGDDMISGGAGADTLDGGAGNDALDGGEGDDVIFYDAADSAAGVLGGAGNDILAFLSGAAPTGFDLVQQGFESAQGRFNDSGGAAWATQTDFYDSLWRLDQRIVVNDDASRTVLDYDQTSAANWSSAYRGYDALDRLDVDVTDYDDGSRAVNDYDQAGAYVWSSSWASYDTLARLDIDVITYDDGAHVVRDLDQANAQAWAQTWAQYDSLGRLDIDIFTYDNGSRAVRDLDQANTQTWSQTWAQYDSQGRLDVDVVTNDDGSYAIRDLDQAGQFSWASQWWLYDAGGALIAFQGVNDDGSIFG